MESLFLTILLLLLLPFCTTAQQACSNSAGNYTADSTYRRNLVNVLTTIAADDQSDSGFYNFSSGQGPDRVNAIGLCRGDLGPADCRGCITNATRRVLVDCPNQKEAVGWYDNCLIRYSNRTLYGLLGPTRPSGPTYYWNNVGDAPDPAQFNAALLTLLTRLQTAAASGSSVKKYAAGRETQGFVTIYGLVQCSPDLSRPLCEDCLTESFSQLPSCCEGKVGGVIRNPICEVRYETYRFVPDTEPLTISPPSPPSADTPPPSPQGVARSKTTSRIVAIVVPIVSAAVLGVILFCCRRRLKRSRIWTQRSSQNGTRDEIGHEGSLQFDFDTIRTATDDFADGSKLGEGGFGAVYKGTLPNGQDVAVKRLDKDSGQGDLEFKNEVRLVAKLQHRNLVRLLGFCLEGRERLLIYEFVPNASLDHFLFDQEKRVYLNWERRHKIIGGIARGLVYLHEDSRLRIIHRDLKASNILLDADMNPKIADFGMARLFDMDETQGNTSRIVGTYGYMAPEYLMHGQFSTKSDVFSFGVLVLEIVSGQKNISRGGSSGEYLLSYVWKNWNAGTYSNVIDPSLENVPGNEIVRCIHIGLLCVQENINDRPPMTLVALMLTSNSMSLKLPSKPAFFIHTGTNSFAGRSFSSEGYGSSSREVTTGSSHSTEALPLSKNEVSITQLYPR